MHYLSGSDFAVLKIDPLANLTTMFDGDHLITMKIKSGFEE